MDGGRPGRGLHLPVRHGPPHPVGDVLPDGPGEEEGLLLDDADLLAQVAPRILPQLHPVQEDAPAGVVVEARQQVDQGGLARAGAPQDAHHLARGCVEIDPLQDRDRFERGSRARPRLAFLLLAFLPVDEAHVLEANVSLDALRRGVAPFVQGLPGHPDDLGEAFEGDEAGGHLGHQPAQVADGPDDLDHQAGVGQVGPWGDDAVDGQERAQVEAGQGLHAAEDVRHRPVGAVHGDEPAPPEELLPVLLLELHALVVLAGEGLHHPDAGQVLLEAAGEPGLLLLVGLVGLPDLLEEVEGEEEHQGDDHHGVEGQAHVQGEERGEVHQEEQGDAANADDLLREETAHRVHVRGGPLQQLPGLHGVVVGEGQPLDVIVEEVAQAQG